MNKQPPRRGSLIVVEGIDGSGKSSVVRGMVRALEQAGRSVMASREPTMGPWGMKVRESFATERLPIELECDYLLRDRQEHVRDVIGPALMAGEDVVLDRYFPSMVAYQGARGVPVDELLAANAFAPRPDLLLILDLPAEVAHKRISARGTPNSFEQLENLRACRAIFQGFVGTNAVMIDATLPEDEVRRQAIAAMWRKVPHSRR